MCDLFLYLLNIITFMMCALSNPGSIPKIRRKYQP